MPFNILELEKIKQELIAKDKAKLFKSFGKVTDNDLSDPDINTYYNLKALGRLFDIYNLYSAFEITAETREESSKHPIYDLPSRKSFGLFEGLTPGQSRAIINSRLITKKDLDALDTLRRISKPNSGERSIKRKKELAQTATAELFEIDPITHKSQLQVMLEKSATLDDPFFEPCQDESQHTSTYMDWVKTISNRSSPIFYELDAVISYNKHLLRDIQNFAQSSLPRQTQPIKAR